MATIVSGKIHIVGVGTTTITADQVADANHHAATATSDFSVYKSTPMITLQSLPDMQVGDADVTLVATSQNEDVEIIYESSDETIATIVSGKVHAVAAGTVSISASQASTDNWNMNMVDQEITITSVTSGVQFARNQQLSFYPNPAKDQVTLEVTGVTLTSGLVSLCDLVGRPIRTIPVIQEGATQKVSFSVSALPEGMYLLILQSDQGTLSRQIEKKDY